MGTDFSFEDMRPENIPWLTKKPLMVSLYGPLKQFLQQNKEKKSSGYSRRVLWINKDNYLTMKTEFYDRRNKLSISGGFEEISEGVWRSNEIIMEQHRRKSKTELETNSRDITSDLSDSLFDTQSLSDRHLINQAAPWKIHSSPHQTDR